MFAALAATLALSSISAPPATVVRVAFDVVNARQIGRRIIHLEDVIGPTSRKIGRDAPAKAVLIVATATEDCDECAGHWQRLTQVADKAARLGGLVVALVLSGAESSAAVREKYVWSAAPFIIALDTHRIVRQRLGLTGPGNALVIRSDGSVIGDFASGRTLDTPIKAFLKELEERQ